MLKPTTGDRQHLRIRERLAEAAMATANWLGDGNSRRGNSPLPCLGDPTSLDGVWLVSAGGR